MAAPRGITAPLPAADEPILSLISHHPSPTGRTALDLGLPPALAISIYGNLGSTLMGADHSDKAITALDAGIELAESAGLDVSEVRHVPIPRWLPWGTAALLAAVLRARHACECSRENEGHRNGDAWWRRTQGVHGTRTVI